MAVEVTENNLDSSIPASFLQQLQSNRYGSQDDEVRPDPTIVRRPNNAWNYRGQRKRFSHLVRHPPSQTNKMGTRDISFIHDGKQDTDKASEVDKGETLLPSNFHLVRSKHVAGLETRPGQHTTHLCDVDKQLRIFPSLQPNKRFEALQLNRTLDVMLEELGADDVGNNLAQSQIHNLIEMVKKEQNIYDAIFYEIIRQVTVGCKERGELLSKLRRYYADLLARVPRQINSLHCELIAQRAYDTNLTQELQNFKDEIRSLTEELSALKKHDSEITNEAEKSKEELRFALTEAAKNSSVLNEYHQLYELQRVRLEKQIKSLIFERDIWNSTAYSLAIKLIEENDLTIVRRLYVSERAWSKMANHFTVFLTERDSSDLKDLQEHVETWRDLAIQFNKNANEMYRKMRVQTADIENDFCEWVRFLTEKYIFTDFAGSRRIKTPENGDVDTIIDDCEKIKLKIEEFLSVFEDIDAIVCHGLLSKMGERVENWTDKAIEIYSRHRSMEGKRFPQHDVMASLNETVQKMQHQLHLITTGENGINNRSTNMISGLNTWKTRLMERVHEMDESEWLKFVDLFNDYGTTCVDMRKFLGSVVGLENPLMKDIPVLETVTKVTTWLSDTLDGIESEDGKLTGMVTLMQSDLLTWMSSCLVLLVPDKSNNKLLREITNPSTVTAHDLVNEQGHICQRCIDLTEYIGKCTHGIVTEQVAMNTNSTDSTLLDQLKTFQLESFEWEKAAEYLSESLQQIAQSEITRIAQSLDEDGKINTIEFDMGEKTGAFAESLYMVGSNENITSRSVTRPNGGISSDPLTETSDEALKTLSTVEKLQIELLDTEDRAITAEKTVEQLEERIRVLEKAMSRGETLPHKESEETPSSSKDRKASVAQTPPPTPPKPTTPKISVSLEPPPKTPKGKRKSNRKGK